MQAPVRQIRGFYGILTGIDVVSDGETSKIGYSTYVKDRLSGFAGHHPRPPHLDLAPHPDLPRR
jgi:5-methyltetrahydropteroyltriglutamate--homocysteine methyltransferase